MNKRKLIILIIVTVLLPFILIGIFSFIKNNPPTQPAIESTITPTPTTKTSNISEYKTISGRIVETNPEFIVINTNGQNENFEFDRDIDITPFKTGDVVTLVFSKEGRKSVMDIIKR